MEEDTANHEMVVTVRENDDVRVVVEVRVTSACVFSFEDSITRGAFQQPVRREERSDTFQR